MARNGNRTRQTNPNLPTKLDLHFCTLATAVTRVTSFLESHRAAGTQHVEIITGTGSHSANGPVLRTAVQKLLERRSMQFTRNTPAAFQVNPCTGDVWYNRQESADDTKVVLRDGHDDNIRMHQADARQRKRQGMATAMGARTMRISSAGSDAAAAVTAGPSLKEVAKSEAEWNQARMESLELLRHETKQETKQEKELTRAVQDSIQQEERLEREEQEGLEQAVMRSKRVESVAQEEEERMLQQALEASQNESTSETLLPDDELEKALQDALTLSLAETTAPAADVQHDEEERMIQQALALSLQ